MSAEELGEIGKECICDFQLAGFDFVEEQKCCFAGRFGMRCEIVYALMFTARIILLRANL